MDQITFWRIFLVLGTGVVLGVSGLFALKLLLSITGRRKFTDIISRN